MLIEQIIIEEDVQLINRFFAEEEGQTLVEYGLLISLIALVVIGVLAILGNRVKNSFQDASDAMNGTTP